MNEEVALSFLNFFDYKIKDALVAIRDETDTVHSFIEGK